MCTRQDRITADAVIVGTPTRFGNMCGQMRPVDGWETLERLKADEKTRDIPVAIHTAKHVTPEENQRYSHLIDDYILISTTQRQLFEAIRTRASGERCMELRLEELKRKFHSGRAPAPAAGERHLRATAAGVVFCPVISAMGFRIYGRGRRPGSAG
ncbi:MAG: hypothetical protein JXA08_10180 [Methanomicrobiaceae archaeon]|nr:hypothetical protein [Methanomicrobiaceae archaeon]